MDIGVRELKQNLSAILERAARGEIIRVTDRGRPKAVIGPALGVASLQAGIDAGWIAPPSLDAPPQRVARVSASRSVAQALIEDRGR